jgi:hypothetical protein
VPFIPRTQISCNNLMQNKDKILINIVDNSRDLILDNIPQPLNEIPNLNPHSSSPPHSPRSTTPKEEVETNRWEHNILKQLLTQQMDIFIQPHVLTWMSQGALNLIGLSMIYLNT